MAACSAPYCYALVVADNTLYYGANLDVLRDLIATESPEVEGNGGR